MTFDVQAQTRSARYPPAAVLAVHAFVFVALTWWSWRKWPDPLVDFGRELYVPWQITRGKVLYRDLASLFGPLSPYVNALWFRLFGVSLTTLAVCNLAILAVTTAGIYHLLRVSTDRVTASGATLTVLLLCGFSEYVYVGNYNFVAPYAHEATHGMALSVATFVALYHGIRLKRLSLFGLSGLCFGAVLLTKPETALAAAAAIAVGLARAAWLDRRDHRAWRGVIVFAVAVTVAPLVFLAYFYFGAGMSRAEAMRAVATGWTSAFGTDIARNVFYRRGIGLDDLVGNGMRMLRAFGGFVLFVAVAVALAWIRPRRPFARALHIVGELALLLVAAFTVLGGEFSPALPLIAVAGCAGTRYLSVQSQRERERALTRLPLLMWSTFGVVLLAKMWLNARMYHYGFYLALPAVSVTVVLLLWLVPHALASSKASAAAGRARPILVATVVVAIIPLLALANGWYRTKVVPVGADGDRFFASSDPALWQGAAVQSALEWLERHAPRGATLTVLPEGVMINYLSRRETPVRFINFMPPEIVAFSEREIVESLDARPPDFVLLVHKNTAEYGYASFGSSPDYGLEILTWVRRRYETAIVIGRDPMSESGFGIEILKRVR